MTLMGLLFLYLICPFLELGIIIFLAVKNHDYKRINEELRRSLKEKQKEQREPEPATLPSATPMIAATPTVAATPVSAVMPVQKTGPAIDARPADFFLKQGTIPLVIGVLFIILSGLIFATTTWSHLADIGKVFLVLAGSITCFGVSFLAVKKLQIEKTGKAFYILGSIFLFVTVLSMGYFGILGADFALTGRYRYLLLFVGIVLADGALFAGLKQFGDKIYAYICLFGVTLGMACLLGGFELSQPVFTTGMACYGMLAVLLTRKAKGVTERYLPKLVAEILPSFTTLNLWGISLLVLGAMGFGMISGLVTFAMAGIHLFLGMEEERGHGSVYACGAFLFTGVVRMIAPEAMDGWLYAGAISVMLLTILEHGDFLNDVCRSCFRWAGIIAAVILFLATGMVSITELEITLSGVICMGILTADITILALEKRNAVLSTAWSVMVLVLLHYIVYYIPMDNEYRILIVAAVCGALFFAGKKMPDPFSSTQGDAIDTAVIVVDTCALLLGSQVISRYAWPATAAILILVAVSESWSRRIPVICGGMPLVWGLLTWTIGTLLRDITGSSVSFEVIVFAFLILIMAWDIGKKDRFLPGILLIGTLSALEAFWWAGSQLPFCLLIAGYLMMAAERSDPKKRIWFDYGISLYLLAGSYLAVYDFIEVQTVRIMVMAGVYLLLWGVCRMAGKMKVMGSFFELTGSLLYLGLIGSYYMDASLGLLFLVPVLSGFAGVYLLCYHGRLSWLNLATALVTLGIPVLLTDRYGFNENQLYGTVLAAVLTSGLLFRRYRPLICWQEEGGLRIDWYHILVVLVLVPMQIPGSRPWDFVYLLLLAAYVMQYAAVPSVRRVAYTATGVLLCMASWKIPFPIPVWPLVLLELRLIPLAGLIFSLPYIWGRKKEIRGIQTILYLLCLLALVLDAFDTQNIVDAFIIEGGCLVIFLFAHHIRCKRWVYLSGGIITGVAIYLTKSFWLSLSWWVYLLAAGIGLIIFAAINERKKSGK